MPAHETQGKLPKGSLGAAGAAAMAVALAIAYGNSGSSSSGGNSEQSGGKSSPTTAASHESHATHAAVTPTKARVIGGRVIFAVETHDDYSGTTLEACVPGSAGSPTLLTTKSQATATSLGALGNLRSSDSADGVLCEIDFDNLYNNPNLDDKVSSGSSSENGVGAIFEVTLAADGAGQGKAVDVQRVAPKGTVR